MYKKIIAVNFLAILLVVQSSEIRAQSNYPNKPITIVLPYTPGGPGDTIARLVANDLSQRFGQTVLVDNRSGAGGNIGTAAVVKAAPDGYTILISAMNNFVVNQFLFKDIGFDPLETLEPVTILADIPLVLFLNTKQSTPTFESFVEYARAHRGKLNYTSPGVGTTLHLATEIINKKYDLRMTHIPFRGAAPAMQALLANEVHAFLVGAGPGVQHVKAGKLHAVTLFNAVRFEAFPNTPTAAEVGLGDIKAHNWWGVAVPKGTPPEIIRKLNDAMRQALATPALQLQLPKMGAVVIGGSPAETARRMREEADYWRETIKRLDIKID